MAVSPSMASLPRARRFDWNNLGVRAASAAVLAPAAIFLMWMDPRAFLVLVAIAVALISVSLARALFPAGAAMVRTISDGVMRLTRLAPTKAPALTPT